MSTLSNLDIEAERLQNALASSTGRDPTKLLEALKPEIVVRLNTFGTGRWPNSGAGELRLMATYGTLIALRNVATKLDTLHSGAWTFASGSIPPARACVATMDRSCEYFELFQNVAGASAKTKMHDVLGGHENKAGWALGFHIAGWSMLFGAVIAGGREILSSMGISINEFESDIRHAFPCNQIGDKIGQLGEEECRKDVRHHAEELGSVMMAKKKHSSITRRDQPIEIMAFAAVVWRLLRVTDEMVTRLGLQQKRDELLNNGLDDIFTSF